jgi:hypothetical protein
MATPSFLFRGISTPAIRAMQSPFLVVCAAASCYGISHYPCRCLCFGVRLQMTRITPLRLITLQYSQRGFTDARTLISFSLLSAPEGAT